MHCPQCRLDLITAEIDSIELDYCVHGHGIWFDAGEIEAFLHSPTSALDPQRRGSKGQRRCPRCRRKMHLVEPDPGLILDVCSRGHGVWFDPGEIERLATALAKQGKIHGLGQLHDAFGHLHDLMGEAR